MQLDRRLVGKRDSSQYAVDVLIFERVEKHAIHHCSDSPTLRVVSAINRRLDASVVRGPVAKGPGARPTDDESDVFRDEQAMPFRARMLVEPSRALLDRDRLKVERDGSVDDIVVVNFG